MSLVPSSGTGRRSFRVADKIWDAAAEVASKEGETVSDVIRDSLVSYVEMHGDALWSQALDLAEERGDDLSDVIRHALENYVQQDR